MSVLPCLDCGVDTSSRTGIGEYYHVREAVWGEAFGRPDAPTVGFVEGVTDAGFLCIGCLELRLGRRLTADDFSIAPVNYDAEALVWHSDRLIDRLGGGEL